MITRLVYFVCYVIIIFALAWALTVVVDVVPIIPAAIKSVLNMLIWVIALISVVLLALRTFAGSLPTPA